MMFAMQALFLVILCATVAEFNEMSLLHSYDSRQKMIPCNEGEEQPSGSLIYRCQNGRFVPAACVMEDGSRIPIGLQIAEMMLLILSQSVSLNRSWVMYVIGTTVPCTSEMMVCLVYLITKDRNLSPCRKYDIYCSSVDGHIYLCPELFDLRGTNVQNSFVISCVQGAGSSIQTKIVGCIDDNGQQVQPDSVFQWQGGQYRCIVNPNGAAEIQPVGDGGFGQNNFPY